MSQPIKKLFKWEKHFIEESCNDYTYINCVRFQRENLYSGIYNKKLKIIHFIIKEYLTI